MHQTTLLNLYIVNVQLRLLYFFLKSACKVPLADKERNSIRTYTTGNVYKMKGEKLYYADRTVNKFSEV